jgi:MoxR-like ATPase
MEEINEEQAAPAISNDIAFVTTASEKIKNEIAKVIVGQDSAIDLMLSALFIGGHILLEGVPGIAKTLTAKNAGENYFGRLFQNSIHAGFNAYRYRRNVCV